MIRLRIQRATCPRPALILTDTPRPDCHICDGGGGIEREYGHPETGEYAGSDWDSCTCWNQKRCWLLLPLPRLPRALRRTPPGYSDEPPF
ncbi:hypothetical protein ACH4UT_27955 [Streptomyces sp. NPDC020799]|uniref:hypothetical protein n=1 Tax=Streptomyces sp. NPDC020799 TaxID=3365091 RepID=UPI0037AA4508